MNIADKILKLRKDMGLSQEALAEKLEVSRQSVSKWESGTALPDTDKIIAMSKLFGVSTDYLLMNDEPEAPSDVPENIASEKTPSPKKKKPVAKIIALILAVCVIVTSISVPLYYGGIKEAWWAINGGKVKYPYVLIHGLGGWGEGEGINETLQYWGAGSCDLKTYLTEQGYEVYMPSVGPISSTWDRVCELYAQITGTTVDYGEAHSKEHNHERFGRTYDTPLVANWGKKINGGQRVKINLIGHSFGGATVRLLASMLEYGSEAETAVTGKETSPLFTGGKGDWVYSVTALCAPHNGSSLTEILNKVGGIVGVNSTTDLLIKLCFGIADIGSSASGVYDFKLDHFGITGSNPESAIETVTNSGNDHAAYDLSPDGAAKLNEMIQTVEGVYYFSYSYSTTHASTFITAQVPDSSTLPILYPFSLAMGSFYGTTAGGISIDDAWRENDGLVSVISATAPSDEAATQLVVDPKDYPDEWEKLETGVWNVVPTKDGDHGKVIGLGGEADETQQFYVDLFKMTDSLER